MKPAGAEALRLGARRISRGYGEGEALVARTRLSLFGGLNPATGEIYEIDSPLLGKSVSGKVLVITSTKGSAAVDKILVLASREGVAPAAIIFTEIDPVAAARSHCGSNTGRNGSGS